MKVVQFLWGAFTGCSHDGSKGVTRRMERKLHLDPRQHCRAVVPQLLGAPSAIGPLGVASAAESRLVQD